MKCPYCNKQMKVPNRAWHNADSYSHSVRVTTECCGNIVLITPVRSYEVCPYTGQATVDDWGVPVGPESIAVYKKLNDL